MIKGTIGVLRKLGLVGLALYAGWMAWETLGPRRPEIGPARREMLDVTVRNIADELGRERTRLRSVALMPLENDPTGAVTMALRSAIEQRGILDLRDRTVGEKFRDLLNLRPRGYGEAEKALARARNMEVNGVLYGTVRQFESSSEKVTLDVDLTLAEAETGRIVFQRTFPETRKVGSLGSKWNYTPASGSFPWLSRLLFWAVLVLLIPVFSIRFVRTMVRKKSNRSNAFVLTVYTLVDALVLALLIGSALTAWWAVPIFAGALAAAFAYNVQVMTFALRLET
jgi:hypothetical protein